MKKWDLKSRRGLMRTRWSEQTSINIRIKRQKNQRRCGVTAIAAYIWNFSLNKLVQSPKLSCDFVHVILLILRNLYLQPQLRNLTTGISWCRGSRRVDASRSSGKIFFFFLHWQLLLLNIDIKLRHCDNTNIKPGRTVIQVSFFLSFFFLFF